MSVTKFILQTDRITTCALQSARRSGSRFGSLIVSTTRPCFKENRGRVFLCRGQSLRSHTLIFFTQRLATGSREADQGQAAEDRKSTRLNSSHPSISYAVFCLKKKNKA